MHYRVSGTLVLERFPISWKRNPPHPCVEDLSVMSIVYNKVNKYTLTLANALAYN